MREAALIRTICVLVAMTAPHRARAEPPPDLPIVATPVRPDHNAAKLAQACGAALAKAVCATDPAIAFCKNPLDLRQPVPTVDQLDHLSQGECNTITQLTVKTEDAPAAVGATWQDDVLRGLVAFLVKRAKAEALASLVNHLQRDVCGDSIGAFVLPSTCGLLGDADAYSDPISWTVLRGAFQADLRALPARVVQRTLGSEAAEPLIALAQIIPLLEAGGPPIDVLVGLRIRYAPKVGATCARTPVSCTLLLVGEVVEIMDPAAVVNPADRPRRDAIALRLTRDSLHEVGVDLPAADCTPAGVCPLASALATVERLLAPLRDAGAPAAAVVKAGADRQVLAAAFRPYTEQVAAALASSMVALAQARGLAADSAGIGAALVHLEHALRNARERDYVGALLELHAAFLDAGVKLPPWLSKYGGFMAELATAQGKDEVEQALDAAAAPVGAWRAKRGHGHHMLSLQGYVGIQGGLEWLGGEGAPSGTAWHGGLFVPVGLEVSFGFAHSWSAGVLFSAIDLGALADARTSDAMTSSTSTLGFRQVFSPGVHAVLGLGSLPLSAGVGISLSPELRSIDLSGGVSKDANALRLSVFLAIDIAIFEL